MVGAAEMAQKVVATVEVAVGLKEVHGAMVSVVEAVAAAGTAIAEVAMATEVAMVGRAGQVETGATAGAKVELWASVEVVRRGAKAARAATVARAANGVGPQRRVECKTARVDPTR